MTSTNYSRQILIKLEYSSSTVKPWRWDR